MLYDDIIIYSFSVKSPTAAEIKAAADRRAAQAEGDRIAAQTVAAQVAAQAEKAQRQRERQEKREDFLQDERRFWSIGINVGSMYGVPALIGVAGLAGSIAFTMDAGFGYGLLGIFVFGIPLAIAGASPLIFGLEDETFSPAITGNINTTLPLFPYKFIELGCDALYINLNGRH